MLRNGGRGAFYLLTKRDEAYGRTFVRTGVIVGVIAACLQLFPTGDMQGKQIAQNQPVTLAAMEGLFETQQGAPLVILGQPDVQKRRLDNPLEVPNMLSFLTYRRWTANVKGLDNFSQELWPDRIALLYYSYHVMVGLGTIFIAVMVVAVFLLSRGKLYDSRWMLWLLMICVPLPYIANTAGWMTAELVRQPWLIYGLMRTARVATRGCGKCLVHAESASWGCTPSWRFCSCSGCGVRLKSGPSHAHLIARKQRRWRRIERT